MSEEKRLMIENDLCMNKSKAQVINLYLELMKQYNEEIEYEQHCNEQLRNKITNLEYKIKRLEEDNKYKEVLDKIKEYIENHILATETELYDKLSEILEEIE